MVNDRFYKQKGQGRGKCHTDCPASLSFDYWKEDSGIKSWNVANIIINSSTTKQLNVPETLNHGAKQSKFCITLTLGKYLREWLPIKRDE